MSSRFVCFGRLSNELNCKEFLIKSRIAFKVHGFVVNNIWKSVPNRIDQKLFRFFNARILYFFSYTQHCWEPFPLVRVGSFEGFQAALRKLYVLFHRPANVIITRDFALIACFWSYLPAPPAAWSHSKFSLVQAQTFISSVPAICFCRLATPQRFYLCVFIIPCHTKHIHRHIFELRNTIVFWLVRKNNASKSLRGG